MVMLESAIHVISDCSILIELCLLSYFSALWPIAVSLAFTLAKWRFVWQVTFLMFFDVFLFFTEDEENIGTPLDLPVIPSAGEPEAHRSRGIETTIVQSAYRIILPSVFAKNPKGKPPAEPMAFGLAARRRSRCDGEGPSAVRRGDKATYNYRVILRCARRWRRRGRGS